ncbi:nickel ABC transporter permease [Alicyclobacillus mengziensis]|uniref:Nickel import system permease protein NikB n=1 Tax=Alicyclobacillus mengziensis TaxID=2931921 RepID=A0A9X7Z868_9BACL|nr:nickel ABC transporter permease [Alicyclobacillus mengziensis]QSO49307.1 ABC transporter permease [Alicyclobacillus mengziensis]
MARYIVLRLLHTVIVLLGISLIVFITVRLTGNPVAAMLQSGTPSKQAIAQLTAALGLNKPLIVQYFIFLKGAVTLNFGTSYATGQPVMQMIMSRMGATAELAVGGIIVGLLLAFPVGIASAIWRGTFIDLFGRSFALLGISFPNYWLGTMLILIFSVWLHLFPVAGNNGLVSLVLPSVTLGLILAGILARLVRSSMLDVLSAQYLTTARAKGLHWWRVTIFHALRNALLPTITMIGLQFGGLLGGIVILEQVFAWPGVGQLVIQAINQRDYPVVQGVVLFLAFLMIMVNLLTDLSYAFVDPRVRLGGDR